MVRFYGAMLLASLLLSLVLIASVLFAATPAIEYYVDDSIDFGALNNVPYSPLMCGMSFVLGFCVACGFGFLAAGRLEYAYGKPRERPAMPWEIFPGYLMTAVLIQMAPRSLLCGICVALLLVCACACIKAAIELSRCTESVDAGP